MYQQAGNFFIGLGPVFSGIGSLILNLYLFLPQTYKSFHSHLLQHLISNKLDLSFYKKIAGALFVFSKSLFTLDNLLNPLFWLFLFTAISISSHIALSKADIHGSAKGLMMIYFVLILFNAATSILGFNSYTIVVKLSQLNTYVIAFSSIAFLFSFFTLVISFLLYKLKQHI
jgi:tryptophan-rich sensory protein